MTINRLTKWGRNGNESVSYELVSSRFNSRPERNLYAGLFMIPSIDANGTWTTEVKRPNNQLGRIAWTGAIGREVLTRVTCAQRGSERSFGESALSRSDPMVAAHGDRIRPGSVRKHPGS